MAEPKLLSGGNPQIHKGDGDGPVQAYIAAVPGWKQAVCREVDALITRTLPDVRKAVKWNSPFYGAADQPGWFLTFHCYERYLKVAFLRGSALEPMPPIGSKTPNARYLHIHEDGVFDAAQFAAWVTQASGMPGETM